MRILYHKATHYTVFSIPFYPIQLRPVYLSGPERPQPMFLPQCQRPRLISIQDNKQSCSYEYLLFWKTKWKIKILHRIIARISLLQSALNFFMNGILIYWCCSEQPELFHTFKGIHYLSLCSDFVLHAALDTWPYT